MAYTPRNSLGTINWKSLPGEKETWETEVPGIVFFGWWEHVPPPEAEFQALSDYWPPDSITLALLIHSPSEEPGGGCELVAFVRVLRYPADGWLDIIENSLRHFTDRGAAIAWAGGYECSIKYAVGRELAGCYAAYTPDLGLVCLRDLNDPLRYIEEDRQAVRLLHRSVAATLRR